ncbi:MAG TPA: ribosome biogenesis GTPase Der [Ignavibacteriaceae bacterium]|nr:ribosome biogenesis GTPase Der [Ignavibacteriaceae bacterium]
MKTPIVAIVGRPNVGKSTLFNRLIGKRDAIVDDQSGVTRDRNYSDVEWNGKIFRLIDTGGYVPDSKDLFETAIREQVQLAVNEADTVLFMVDSRAGLLPVEREIFNMLRTSGKKFLVIVNKVDSEKFESSANEFYNLGVDNIFAVSALVGRNIGDLLDVIVEPFPVRNQIEEDKTIKIAIVGRPNVGKSSLTNALLGEDRSIVTDVPGTTRDSLDSTLKYYGQELILVDTAGLRKKKKVQESVEYFSTLRSLKAISEADVVIILVDATVGFDKQDQKIIDEAERRKKGIILAVNKWDLIEKVTNTSRELELDIKQKLGALDYVPIIFISALTKQRIYKLVDLCIRLYNERNKKISTSDLNEKLMAEIDRFPPPATGTGKEIKIKYITQGGDKYPVFLFFSNFPKYVPDNYKRFLENTIRKIFGFEGIPITLSFRQK